MCRPMLKVWLHSELTVYASSNGSTSSGEVTGFCTVANAPVFGLNTAKMSRFCRPVQCGTGSALQKQPVVNEDWKRGGSCTAGACATGTPILHGIYRSQYRHDADHGHVTTGCALRQRLSQHKVKVTLQSWCKAAKSPGDERVGLHAATKTMSRRRASQLLLKSHFKVRVKSNLVRLRCCC